MSFYTHQTSIHAGLRLIDSVEDDLEIGRLSDRAWFTANRDDSVRFPSAAKVVSDLAMIEHFDSNGGKALVQR